MTGRPVRVGLLVGTSGLQPWQARLASNIVEATGMSTPLILTAARSSRQASSIAAKLLGLLEKFERRAFIPSACKKRSDIAQTMPQAHIHNVAPGATLAGTLEEIDIVVALVPISKALADQLVPHTVLWALASGDANDAGDPNFGFWDMFNTNGISRLALLQLSASGASLIAEGILQIQFSFARNKTFLQEKSVSLIHRELRRWSSTVAVDRAPVQSAPKALNLVDVIRYSFQLVGNLAPKIYKAVLRKTGRRFNRWSLFVGSGAFDADNMSSAHETQPPPNEFWADPFLFRAPGSDTTHVFFENYEFSTGLGKLSVGLLNGHTVENIGDALVKPHHLSYPFVYAYDGKVYMIPETAQARQIEIWQATSYPLEWQLHKVVMQGTSCADTTIFEHDGEWWMFTSMSNDSFGDHCSELCIFKVDSPLLNKIEPHELNPVIIDARVARNAGRIAVRNGKLTRLAQNNSFHYGYGFSLVEIEKLNLQEYSEKKIYSAKPGFANGITSTHQMDHNDDIHIFDGLREFG